MDEFYFVGKVPGSARQEAWLSCLQSPRVFQEAAPRSSGSVDDVPATTTAEWAPLTHFFLKVLIHSQQQGEFRFTWPWSISGEEKSQLMRLLWQMGSEASEENDQLKLKAFGWRQTGDALHFNVNRFPELSAAFLSLCFYLPFDLFIATGHSSIERHNMAWEALQVMTKRGLKVDSWGGDLRIPKGQGPQAHSSQLDPDLTKAFFISSMAAVAGHATLVNFYPREYQEGAFFPLWLRRMNVRLSYDDGDFRVDGPTQLKAIDMDVHELTDAFPLLAALAMNAHGESRFHGHGIRSPREQKLISILQATGAKLARDGRDLVIMPPSPDHKKQMSRLSVTTDGDGILDMAVSLLIRAGWPIDCSEAEGILNSVHQMRGVH